MEQVREGYKQTEIGLIPVDWKLLTIEDVIEFSGGSQPPRSTFVFNEKSDYVRLLQIRDYKTDKYVTFIPKHLVQKSCTKDDTMIGRYGPPIFQILRGLEGAYNVALIKASPKNVEKEYAYYILKQDKLFRFVEKLSQRSSGQTGVDLVQLKAYKIPLPPTLTEQKAISSALSDVDELINSLDKLIAKKKAIKQGAMQELLTGKKRLPGFDGEWKKYKISDLLIDFRNGYAFSASGYSKEGMPIITMAQIGLNGNFQFDIGKINFWPMSEANNLKEFYVKKGDLIISMTDVTPEKNLIGRMTVVDTEGPLLLNQRVGLLKINENLVNPVVLKSLSNMKEWRTYSKGVASLGVQANIGTMDIKNGEVCVAEDINEQNAIADVLLNFENEIKALENKKVKLQNIKQGMMQELLTGKTRLV